VETATPRDHTHGWRLRAQQGADGIDLALIHRHHPVTWSTLADGSRAAKAAPGSSWHEGTFNPAERFPSDGAGRPTVLVLCTDENVDRVVAATLGSLVAARCPMASVGGIGVRARRRNRNPSLRHRR